MYTSAARSWNVSDPVKKTVRIYLLAALFTAVLGHVYEHFSHGVYARGMFWAFLIPLMGGAAVYRVIALLKPRVIPSGMAAAMYHSGIATLTVGSLFKGALDIYGTGSGLVIVYWIAGAALTVAGAVRYLATLSKAGSGTYRF